MATILYGIILTIPIVILFDRGNVEAASSVLTEQCEKHIEGLSQENKYLNEQYESLSREVIQLRKDKRVLEKGIGINHKNSQKKIEVLEMQLKKIEEENKNLRANPDALRVKVLRNEINDLKETLRKKCDRKSGEIQNLDNNISPIVDQVESSNTVSKPNSSGVGGTSSRPNEGSSNGR